MVRQRHAALRCPPAMQVFGNFDATVERGTAWNDAMQRGDLRAAWRFSDAALAARDPATRDDPRLPYHLRWVWDGTPAASRRVLIRCYHGLGDTIQFARFLPPLRAVAAHVTLETQPALLPLLARAADVVHVFDPASPLPAAEVDIEIMELCHALRLAPDGLPTPLAQPQPIGSGVIGLCWEAGDWDRARSVPLLALLDALPPRPRRHLSLQRGPAASQALAPAFRNPADADPDIRRTAALIRGTRLVVTIDTMVAHLAGALGAPTLLLLRHDADWRWGRGARSIWYPSLHLLRQHVPGDWSRPLAALSRLAAG